MNANTARVVFRIPDAPAGRLYNGVVEIVMGKEIDVNLLSHAFQEWRSAVNGSKGYIVQKHADVFGVSFGTMHRRFKKMGFLLTQKKEKVTKGQSKIAGLHDMAEQIARLYAFIPPRAGRRPAIEYAVRKAIDNGMLPESAREISVSTFARVFRERGLLDTEGRVLRFQAEHPMEQVQYDVSGSEYLYVVDIAGGDPVLRVRASKGYKNKDKYENLRVWYHGMVDDHSRYWLAMPVVAAGESSIDAIKFCRWAFALKEDERIIFHGLPGRIYMDNGALARSEATRNFLENQCGVVIKTHEPESPSDTGKIEIKWRQLWSSFEAAEFLMDPHWDKREYRLSELKARLTNYMVELNNKKHPYMNCTKADAWRRIMLLGGVVGIEESAFDGAFRKDKRRVGRDGLLQIDNERYFVKGLLDAEVWVYRGILHGEKSEIRNPKSEIVVEDMLTHKRYEAVPFEVPKLDAIRMDKKLAGERIREEAQELRKTMAPGEFKGIYELRNEECGMRNEKQSKIQNPKSEILIMPVRTKETREVEDVFDVDVYPTIEEAMREFYEIAGVFVGKEQLREIEELVWENGLKKQYVVDLALEIQQCRDAPLGRLRA